MPPFLTPTCISIPDRHYLAECFPLIHGVRMAQTIFWNQNVATTLLVSGGIVLLQCLAYGAAAFYVIRRKLIA